MSRGYNKSGLHIDVGLLRDHISKLREEKKLVERLYDNVSAMRSCSDPSEYGQYYTIFRDIDQFLGYFARMIKELSEAEAEAIRLSRDAGEKIDDNAAQVRRAFL